MKRGDIYFADLNPTIGSEVKKKRPVLIISNNANNKMASIVTVIPLTSNTKNVYPFEVLIEKKDSGLKKNSKAQCNQIRTISKKRFLGKTIGRLQMKSLDKIEAALKLHLAIK